MFATRSPGGSTTESIDVFAVEFEEALRILAILPEAGTTYPQAGVAGLRRLYIRRSPVTRTTPSTSAR